MDRPFVSLAAAVSVAVVLVAGCAQAAPPVTPTKAPVAPTRVAEPTRAPAAPTKAADPTKPAAPAQPTAAPAKKVDFPQKGRAIGLIIPWPAGGSTDVAGRLLAPGLEKELGTPVQIVSRPGGGGQVGTTELALAKPDGYSIGYTILPSTITQYLDPERKAAYGRNSFAPVANYFHTPVIMSVQTNSPHKTVKDVVDAARANPDKLKVGAGSLLGPSHLGLMALEKATGTKMGYVAFDGAAPQTTALLGGHIDVGLSVGFLPQFKTGELRVLGVMAREESKSLPGIKTFEAQGFRVSFNSVGVVSAPVGTPAEIIDLFAAAIKKVADGAEHQKKMEELSFDPLNLGPAEAGRFWDEMEAQVRPMMEQARK